MPAPPTDTACSSIKCVGRLEWFIPDGLEVASRWEPDSDNVVALLSPTPLEQGRIKDVFTVRIRIMICYVY